MATTTVVFLVPFDERFQCQKDVFATHMRSALLPGWRNRYPQTEFLLRCVRMPLARSGAFNIGAARNLGAQIVASQQQQQQQQQPLILVFCDADKLPARPDDAVWNFPDVPLGCVRQYYGAPSVSPATTGFGIFAVHASDFFRIGGFPNFWSWGMEDAEFTRRAVAHGLLIDAATSFVPLGDPRVLHLFRGPEAHWLRVVSRVELFRFATGSAHTDGVACLRDVQVEDHPDEIVVRAFGAGTEDSPPSLVLPRHRIDVVPLAKLLVGAASLPSQGYLGAGRGRDARGIGRTPRAKDTAVPRNRLQSLFSGVGR